MIVKLKEQVKKILIEYPETRNSDITLTIEIWKQFCNVDGILKTEQLYDLPREDNIKRIRAKFCEQGNVWAFPTEWKIAKGRGMLEDRWRQSLGYPKLEDTIYPTKKQSYLEKLTTKHTVKAEISPEEKTKSMF